jgi:hypothetical protein
MSFSGAQGGDLSQAGFSGSYEFYLDREGGTTELAAGSMNIPWLAGLIISQGNAMTEAIGRNAVVFCEPEYGNDSDGGGGAAGGYAGMGASSGGLSVAW